MTRCSGRTVVEQWLRDYAVMLRNSSVSRPRYRKITCGWWTTEQVCYHRSCSKGEPRLLERAGHQRDCRTRWIKETKCHEHFATLTNYKLLLCDPGPSSHHIQGNDTSWKRVDTHSDEGANWRRNSKRQNFNLTVRKSSWNKQSLNK